MWMSVGRGGVVAWCGVMKSVFTFNPSECECEGEEV